jgi:hypothetical protein
MQMDCVLKFVILQVTHTEKLKHNRTINFCDALRRRLCDHQYHDIDHQRDSLTALLAAAVDLWTGARHHRARRRVQAHCCRLQAAKVAAIRTRHLPSTFGPAPAIIVPVAACQPIAVDRWPRSAHGIFSRLPSPVGPAPAIHVPVAACHSIVVDFKPPRWHSLHTV